MDVELSQDESEAVRKALTSYLSELRMEITDTDNPEYKRTLRDERSALESAIGKLSGSTGAESSSTEPPTWRLVRLWWSETL